jgi:sugar lactone lactonase YvrE/Tol biopolymer transport system component
MAQPWLRDLLNPVGPVRRGHRPGRRSAKVRATNRRARPLAVELLEDRTLLDATLQAITLASVAPPSVSAAAGSSAAASVSADGRYVAYESTATNLVANQASGAITRNIFLFDRQSQTTTLVSHDAANPAAGGNADSLSAVLSGNGSFLYYLSRATDLVTGETDPAGTENLYVYDTAAGTTRLVTGHLGSATQAADGDTGLLDPSRSTGAPFAVSADGTRVAYVSAAADLVSGMTGLNGPAHANVFLADVSTPTPTTSLISAQAGSPSAGAGGGSPALSADGQWLAFVSDGTSLVPNQAEQTPPGAASAVFLADVSTSTPATRLVSRKFGTTATVAGAASDTPVINQDGSVVAFRSDAPDLVAQQFPGSPPGNVFVYERAFDTVGLVSHAPQQPTVGLGGTPFTPDSQGPLPLSISADGQSIAYQSQAAGLVGAPTPGCPPPFNVFVWQLSSVAPAFAVDGNNSLVSGAGGSASTPANGSSFAPVLSADGSTIAFESTATNLVPGQTTTGSALNVFTTGTAAVAAGAGLPPTLVSSADGSVRVAANADSSGGAVSGAAGAGPYPGSIGLSGDGSVLVFQSSATNLSTAVYKGNSGTDVFADAAGTGLALVSQSAAPVVTAGGDSYVASVSADDRYTAFVSDAFNLVAGQQNNHFGFNVFLRDETTQTVSLVNHVPAPGSPTATGDSGIPQPAFAPDPRTGALVAPPPAHSLLPVVSGDGSAVVFVSNDHDLVSGQQSPGSYNNVFRYNVADGSVTLISHLPSNLTASGAYDSDSPAVSFNGEFVALVSNGGVSLYDANAPQTLTQIAASGSGPSISDDGRYVAYVSQGNAFLYDRQAGTSTLISHDAGSTRGDLLALTAPPAAVTAGQAFALTATVQDALGNPDTTFNGTVSLALGPGSPAGAALGGSITAQAVAGVAQFNDVLLTLAGTGYALTASATGVIPARTAAFAVVPAAASRLVFVTPPSLSLVNEALAPAVVLEAEDAFGNVVTDPPTTVTAALGTHPPGATLSGLTTATTAGGFVRFNALIANQPGTYTLTVDAAGLPSVTSSQFTVTTAQANTAIIAIAGTGAAGFGGDGGPGTAALLNTSYGVAVDAQGDVYIADTNNNRVRKVTPDGTIVTVAGTGVGGAGPDNVPATQSALYGPAGVAVDAAGNLYIADLDDFRVRKVAPNGIITTIAGYPSINGNPFGVAVDAQGNVFVASDTSNQILKIAPGGAVTTVAGTGTAGYNGDNIAATAAKLNSPIGVAVDAQGNLYIAEENGHRVRKVTPAGIITTVAGTGTFGFSGDNGPAASAQVSGPTGVALDTQGNLYIVDHGNLRVRKVNPAGIITTVVGTSLSGSYPGFQGDGGPATQAVLAPWSVAVDAAGNLFIADPGNRAYKVFGTATALTVATPPPSAATAGSAFTVQVSVVDAGGNPVPGYQGGVTVALGPGSPAGAALAGATTVVPVNGVATFRLTLTQAAPAYSLAFSAFGVTGTTTAVFVVGAAAAHDLAFAQQPVNAIVGQPISPAVTAAVRDAYGNPVGGPVSVTVKLGNNATAATLTGTTTVTAVNGVATFSDLAVSQTGAYTLTASAAGLPATTSTSFSVATAASFARITTVAGGGTAGLGDNGPATAASLFSPTGMAFDAASDLYVADLNNHRVRKIAPNGIITTVAGGGTMFGDNIPATAAQLQAPFAVAVDAQNDLYIVDAGATGSGLVRKVTPDGTITTLLFGLGEPEGIAVDAQGNLYIAESLNNDVLELSTTGVVSTVAGTGGVGSGGDGGPATAAQIYFPVGLTFDAQGDLYIAEADGNRVRKVTPAGIISTVAGNGTAGYGGDNGPATAAALNYPSGVAVDAAGNLYVVEARNNRVRKVSPDGTITTAVGTGTSGFAGDNGPAVQARLRGPFGVVVDAQGDVFVSDADNGRVREAISPATQLAITTPPPANVATGAAFGLAVTVEDASGNPVSGYSGSVTLALGPGSPAGAALGGTTTAAIDPDNGIATFSNLTIGQAGVGYSLVATTAGLAGAATGTFSVGVTTATVLAFTSQPAAVTAGVPFTVQVAAQDALGHTARSYTNPVTLTLPGGTVSSNPVQGVATFSNLVIGQPGKNVTLSATAPGLSGVTTAPFNVGAATATRLVVSQPAGVKAGVPFAFTVTAEDGAGNVATGFNGPVTVNLGQNPTGAGLGGSTTVSAVNGVARFTLSVTLAGSGYILSASAAGLPPAATSPFGVAATPELLAISPPVAAAAGSPFAVTVTAEDANGNPDPSFGGTVTLAVGPGSPPGTFLGGPTSVVAVNGTATFSGLQLTQAGSYTLTATTANLLGGFSAPFLVSAGTPAQLALTLPSAATAGSPFTVTVAVQDAQGNTVPSFNGPVSIGLGANPTGATLSGTTPVNAVNGVATFLLTLDKAGSGYTLTAGAGASLTATSLPLAVGGVTATQLGVDEPAFALAGVPFTVTVTAEDSGGNPVPSFNGPVTLALGPASPAGAALGGTLTAQAVNGVATFAGLTLATPGTGYTLAASAGTLSGTGPPPLAVLAGGDAPSSDPVVSADGNAVAYVSAADNLIAGQAVTGFTNVFLYTVATAGNALVSGTTATPANGNSDGPAIDLDGGFVAYRSDATNLVPQQDGAAGNVFLYGGGTTTLVSAVSGTTHTGAGSSFAPAIDGDGSKLVYLSRASDLVPGEQAATTVNVYLYAAPLAANFLLTGAFGSDTVPGNGDASNALIGRHSHPALSSKATNLTHLAGAFSNGYRNVRITTKIDTSLPPGLVLGNNTGPNTPVATFSTTNPYAGQLLPPSYILETGFGDDASFQVSGKTLAVGPGTTVRYADHPSYTIQVLTDVGLDPLYGVNTLTIPVSAPPPLTVTINQAAGQADPSGAGTVSFTVVFSQAVSGFVNGDVALAGSAGATAESISGSGTTYTVAVSGMTRSGTVVASVPAGVVVDGDGVANSASTSSDNTVTAIVPTRLVVTSPPPGSVTAGSGFGFAVSAEDDAGAVAAGYSGSVTVALGSQPGGATLGGTLTAPLVNGVATFTGLTLDRAATGYTLRASSNGLAAATTAGLAVTAAPATHLVVTGPPPGSVTAGAGFGLTVSAEDAFGNVDLTFAGSVTLALAANPGGSTFAPVTATAQQGVATFTGLTLTRAAAGYTLQATGNGLAAATTAGFAVAAAPATHLAVTTPPPARVAPASPFDFAVTAEDDFGNVDPSFAGGVTLALHDNPGGSAFAPVTVAAGQGVAAFSGLALEKAGTGYTLQATADGLAAATSVPFAVVAGAATQLVVAVAPPGSVTAGAPFGLAVLAEDSQGNVDPQFSGGVTLALHDNPGGSAFAPVTVTASQGVAIFTGLTLTRAATGYTLRAGSNGLTSVTTSPVAVVAGAATQLAVTATPPGSVTAGAGFGLTVSAEDAFGNVDRTFAGSVTLALGANPGGSAFDPVTAPASHGVAAFTGLTLNKAATGYTVQAASNGLTAVTTDPFAVAAGPATQLAVTVAPPGSVTAGTGFALTVAAEDAFGNVDRTFAGSVTLALAANPGGSTFAPVTAPASQGVVTFAGLALTRAAGGYTLRASSNGLTAVATDPFTVAAGAATQLVVLVQPPAVVGAFQGFGLVIQAQDALGNVALGYGGSVTVGLAGNPGGASLGGPLTVPVVNGVATFAGLTLSDAGAGYVLQATAAGLASAATSPLTVPPRPTTAQLVAVPVKAGRKKATRLTVVVLYQDTGAVKAEFVAPFQGSAYKRVRVSVRGNQVVVTAKKGKKTVTRTYPA